MLRRTVAAAVVVTCMVAVRGAWATEYPGWGDTGWIYANKRDCCNQAIAIAANYSAQACTTSGGVPMSFAGGGQRGSCTTQWTQDGNGNLMYRCYGESSVWCR